MTKPRVTITIDPHLLEAAKRESSGNLSGFVSSLIETHLRSVERNRRREELRKGYLEGAALDLEIAEEFGA